jgi:hypothetical protein
MRKYLLIALITIASLTAKGQEVDTLSVLKAKALNYTIHKISNPKSYKSVMWSDIIHSPKGLIIMNVFTCKSQNEKFVKLAFSFSFTNDFQLISVNTDPINKQLQELKEELKQAQEEKVKINDARDVQLKALKDSN